MTRTTTRTFGSPRSVVFARLLVCALLPCLALLCCSPHGAAPLLQYIASTYNDQASSTDGGCDYSEGQWVSAPGHARRYNGSQCMVTIGESCTRNGRPDTGYLEWRWQPSAGGCHLPGFDAARFLAAFRGKHLAFFGDSMARNQAESLVCLLATASPYRLVYRDRNPAFRKWWRWAFPSHNVTISTYWAPFLVRATGMPVDARLPYNSVFLHELEPRWSAEVDTMDVAVVTIGHWFPRPTIYYNGSSEVLGTHLLPQFNHTEIGFLSTYREIIRTTIRRLVSSPGTGRTVVVSTFSPPHFEKAQDDLTTCVRTRPYMEGEREVDTMHAELRNIVREETAAAARNTAKGTRLELMDVTKLATMRPDGHPAFTGDLAHSHTVCRSGCKATAFTSASPDRWTRSMRFSSSF